MSIYRCTQCGARIEAAEGVKVSTCPACQALFVLPNRFAQKENLYLLASDARHAGNYDMALNYYSRILKVDGAEPEANWGYLLSKYGVELSENALDYGGVIFHRVEHGSFVKDPAYEKMMSYVPQASRYYYEGMARRIDAQHQKLMAISRTLTAPDIYIDCTAAQGTEDFLLSVQVGKALEDMGYRIFHPGMLSGVPRQDLNLYEMAAAEKAEAMIVTAAPGTRWEDARFQAVWRRFLAYRRQDAGRKMLSVFRGIRPEDLPLELQTLQSIPCEGSDLQNRVTEEINRMFGRQNRSAALVKKNLELLRQGSEALEKGDWNKAKKMFEKAVLSDGQEYRAHWGMVCAMTENLKKPALSEEVDHHYRQALQHADKGQAEAYTRIMTALCGDAAWDALLRATKNLTDYHAGENADVEQAEERVKLYLPAFDERFQKLDDWHMGIRRQQELDAVRAAYERRDTAAEPLFAEQEKLEYAYEHTELAQPVDRGGSRLRAILLGLSLTAMLLSFQFLLTNIAYSTNYTSGYYNISRIFFGVSLALIVLWVYCLVPNSYVLIGGLIGAVVLYKITRIQIRGSQLALLLLPAALLFVDRAMMMVRARNAAEAIRHKREAANAVINMEIRLGDAYRKAMDAVCGKYKLPRPELPPYQVSHSAHYKGIQAEKRLIPPLTYILQAVGFLAVMTVAVTCLNNMLYASGWNHITKVDSAYYHVLGLREDGTVKANGRNQGGQCNVSDWKDVIDVGAGMDFSAGLTADGRVLVAAKEDADVQEAAEWTGIKAISVSAHRIVGLKEDGTVTAAGTPMDEGYGVDGWTDVIQILATSHPDGSEDSELVYGVCADGRACLAGSGDVWSWKVISDALEEQFGPEGKYQAESVTGRSGTYAVKLKDGTFLVMGANTMGQVTQTEDWDWSQIVKADTAYNLVTLGIRTDGTVACAGNNPGVSGSVSTWTDIVDVSVSNGHALGLKSDGTVAATGSNGVKELETGDWSHVTSVLASELASFGLRDDGKVETAGYTFAGLTYLNPKSPLGVLDFWIKSLKW